jgi:hypothetical protein
MISINRNIILTSFSLVLMVFQLSLCIAQNTAISMDDRGTSELFDSHVLHDSSTEPIPKINIVDAIADKATTRSSMAYIVQSADDVYGILNMEQMDTITSQSAVLLESIIDFRDRLLAKGGSANACLAGSITYAIHSRLYHELLFAKDADLNRIDQIADKNRIVLQNLLNALADDERWRSEIQTLDPGRNNVSVLHDFLDARGDGPDKLGTRAWMKSLQKRNLHVYPMFDRNLMRIDDLTPHLFLWAMLIDDQAIMHIILASYGNVSDSLQTFYKNVRDEEYGSLAETSKIVSEAKEMLVQEYDRIIDKQGSPISVMTFQQIRGEAVWQSLQGKIINYRNEGRVLDFMLGVHLKKYE